MKELKPENPNDLKERVKNLRAGGFTYEQIGRMVGVTSFKAWRLCNEEEYKRINKSSRHRRGLRNGKALADMSQEEIMAWYKTLVTGRKK